MFRFCLLACALLASHSFKALRFGPCPILEHPVDPPTFEGALYERSIYFDTYTPFLPNHLDCTTVEWPIANSSDLILGTDNASYVVTYRCNFFPKFYSHEEIVRTFTVESNPENSTIEAIEDAFMKNNINPKAARILC
ncbi:uncharacterized protein LOC115632998 [Scaptodrosophila lebanonensis]|uniref:Uncharacterized protein LOC115632998 n=1 Tax=Drosophila lebanonensis TaxID=7225 RepID=A0A6J2UDF6_DROLE|nr:uncharacterized protein LOC115632998 [Scaptodrosophila lebanonensis]